MESQFTQSGMPMMNRFTQQDAFGPGAYDYDGENTAEQGNRKQKITVNLEDAVLEE